MTGVDEGPSETRKAIVEFGELKTIYAAETTVGIGDISSLSLRTSRNRLGRWYIVVLSSGS